MLINKTKKTLLAKEYRYCETEFSKVKGLMFTKKLTSALIFPFKKEILQHIHMFFVWYPIDILWLNKNKKVVQLKENLKPFRIAFARKPALYIIELETGTIKKSKTEIGDLINF